MSIDKSRTFKTFPARLAIALLRTDIARSSTFIDGAMSTTGYAYA
ncbi:MAG TPA: hypothetical protein VE944_02675 [Nostoc sp.]|nr:hypothetical protein [Nostoc sp.]HYX13271.1 hypothetical protein [Nostoc sp.]